MNAKEIADLHKAMLRNYSVGAKVRALGSLGDRADGDSPGGEYARRGDILVVRAIKPESAFPVSVSHEGILDRSFGVAVNEIEVADECS